MKNTNSYSAAIHLVRDVRDWKWPHDHVVSPRDCRIPRTNTPELAKGRKQLLRVLAYLESQAHAENMNRGYK